MEEEEEEALAKIDKDDSGCLDIEEWCLWWLGRVSSLPNPLKQQEAIAKNTFAKFDVDRSGTMDAKELGKLCSALGADFSPDELDQALAEIDEDQSGLIDINEFLLWWTDRAASNRKNTSLIALKMRKLASKAAQVFATDIFTAAWNGDVDLVKSFLDGERRLAQAADSSEYGEGWGALHYACYEGHSNVVSLLLDARVNVNQTNDLGFTALFYAAQRGHIDICKMLIDAGADPSIYGVQPAMENEDGSKSGNDVFMCPVEFVVDYPELKDIFKDTAKCAPPGVPDASQLSASISSSGLLRFWYNFSGPQRIMSPLPIKSWDVFLVIGDILPDCDGGIDPDELTLSVEIPAVPPSQTPHQSEVAVDKGWLHMLHYLQAIYRMKNVKLLRATELAVGDLWGELYAAFQLVADTPYKSKINMETMLKDAIAGCQDSEQANVQLGLLENKIRDVKAAVTAAAAADATAAMKTMRPGQPTATAAGSSASGAKHKASLELHTVVNQAVSLLTGIGAPLPRSTYKSQQQAVATAAARAAASADVTRNIEVARVDGGPKVTMEVAAVNSWAKSKDSDSVRVQLGFPSSAQFAAGAAVGTKTKK